MMHLHVGCPPPTPLAPPLPPPFSGKRSFFKEFGGSTGTPIPFEKIMDPGARSTPNAGDGGLLQMDGTAAGQSAARAFQALYRAGGSLPPVS